MQLLVNFYANVLDTTISDFIRLVTQISAQQSQKGKPIDEIVLQISSSGGSSDHGLLAYNFLKQSGLKITTIGMGNVDSAAIMLFCTGTTRISVPSCRFLIHEATATIQGIFNANKLKEIVKVTERINDDYCTVIASVCNKKLTQVKSDVMKSTVMSSESASKYGLVNIITEEPYIKDFNGLPVIGINNPIQIQPQQHTQI